MNPKSSSNTATELAKERNRAAAERTLMAWVRTSLSLITFGFGIDKIISALGETKIGKGPDVIHSARIVGLSFIALGIFAIWMAVAEHRRILNQIGREEFLYQSRWSLARVVGIVLSLIGLFAFVAILIGAVGGGS